mgnify:CR=1 FL=1
MKINEVEQAVGITKRNIRFYEKEGLLSPQRDSGNGYRDYSDGDVETLRQVKLFRKLDLPLEEIRRIQREAGITTVFVTHDQEEASSIADRVVLLRDGVLQQEDTARGLYENPVNLFAADFLGTPPINQLHGVVQNGRLVLDGGIPAALALPDGLAEGQEIVLAVRAESILPQGDPPAFRTTVLERYSLGKDELVRLQAGPAELRGLVPAELEILPGTELAVGLKKRGVFLFDAKTGVRYL